MIFEMHICDNLMCVEQLNSSILVKTNCYCIMLYLLVNHFTIWLHIIHINLIQVSCSSASTELSNRRRFRKHFQVFPADISLAYGYFGIIHKSKWRKVSIVVEDEFLFTRVSCCNKIKINYLYYISFNRL